MRLYIRRIGSRIFDIMGLDRMGKAYHTLAFSYIFLMLYGTLEGIFVNTLLYRASGGKLSAVIIYRGITYITSGIFMHIAAYVTQKRTPVTTVRMGAAIFLLLYVVLFIGLDYVDTLKNLIAVLSGLGGCFYWAGHNVLIPHYTTKQNRDVGMSIFGVIQGILTLFVPVISGFVISMMPGNTGYRVMFGIGMAAVGVQLFLTTRFASIVQSKKRSELKLAIKLLIRKSSFKLMMGYEFIRGTRDGTFAFVLNMLLFEIITNESLVGINTFFTGVLSITGSWVFGKLVTGKNRGSYAMIATTILTLICASMFIKMTAPTVMLFAALNAFLQIFFLYSYGNTTYDMVSQNELARKCSAEMFAMREIACSLGRVAGLWMMMVFPQTQTGYIQAMCILTVAQYLGAIIMGRLMKQLHRHEAAA